MPLLAEHIIEAHRAALEPRILYSELSQPLFYETAELSGLGYSRKVAFHVRHKTRHTGLAECLGHDLKRDCLSGAGGSGDKSVPVRHLPDDGKRAVSAVGYPKPVFRVVHRYQFYCCSTSFLKNEKWTRPYFFSLRKYGCPVNECSSPCSRMK